MAGRDIEAVLFAHSTDTECLLRASHSTCQGPGVHQGQGRGVVRSDAMDVRGGVCGKFKTTMKPTISESVFITIMCLQF